MIPVYQKIVSRGYGDCMRATIASLLELPLEAVPHFLAFTLNEDCNSWMRNMVSFWRANGYNMAGSGYPKRVWPDGYLQEQTPLRFEDSFNGFFYTVVPSKNFRNISHAVIMDMNGYCAHDPSPLGLYQRENILGGKRVESWFLVEKREEGWESTI